MDIDLGQFPEEDEYEEEFIYDPTCIFPCEEYLYQKIELHSSSLGYFAESVGYLREWEIKPLIRRFF